MRWCCPTRWWWFALRWRRFPFGWRRTLGLGARGRPSRRWLAAGTLDEGEPARHDGAPWRDLMTWRCCPFASSIPASHKSCGVGQHRHVRSCASRLDTSRIQAVATIGPGYVRGDTTCRPRGQCRVTPTPRCRPQSGSRWRAATQQNATPLYALNLATRQARRAARDRGGVTTHAHPPYAWVL